MANKILIVTVYNSENCGSYLQAYAMLKTLEKMGYEVGFYRRTNPRKRFKKAFYNIIKGNIKAAYAIYKQWSIFSTLIGKFHVYSIKDVFYSEVDKVLLGSDTIWNFDTQYFSNNAKLFTGAIFTDKCVFSYAVSVANTSPQLFNTIQKKVGGLKLSKYLVRDKHTQQCLAHAGVNDSQVVCDPSMLLGKKDYAEFEYPVSVSSPYIVLYYFGEIPDAVKESIIAFAKVKKAKVVSLLKYRKWCDVCTPVDPREMVSYYSKANYVITNTFHGCAFAINFNIPFAAHDVGKNKVVELLKTYKCSDRLFTNPLDIPIILTNSIDTKDAVLSERKKSLDLLKEALR